MAAKVCSEKRKGSTVNRHRLGRNKRPTPERRQNDNARGKTRGNLNTELAKHHARPQA